ncbi:MAG: hypothetical protein EXR48_06090 [Dehalococcoidia bacterium]|nr:hypothetical protein [Dehalococcoidia bacterium]
MNKHVFAALYEYGEWANERLLTLASKLTPEQFRRQYSKGYRPIHENLVHLLQVDWAWYFDWRAEPFPRFGAEQLPLVDAIREAWAPLIAKRRAFLADLGDRELTQEIPGRRPGDTSSPLLLWQALLQCANHGMQHRAEIAAMLTDAGHSPGDLDFAYFWQERQAAKGTGRPR